MLILNDLSTNLFLPKDITKYSSYEKSNVILSLFSLLIDREIANRNITLNLLVQSQNYGLTIESRSAIDLVYFGKDQSLNLSLLDYFDGYDVNVDNKNIDVEDILTQQSDDIVKSFIIDAVTNMNYVIKAIMIDAKYLLQFFSQNHLMQVRHNNA